MGLGIELILNIFYVNGVDSKQSKRTHKEYLNNLILHAVITMIFWD
jgi:hypothetical protein